jgi:hypothetical protein
MVVRWFYCHFSLVESIFMGQSNTFSDQSSRGPSGCEIAVMSIDHRVLFIVIVLQSCLTRLDDITQHKSVGSNNILAD